VLTLIANIKPEQLAEKIPEHPRATILSARCKTKHTHTHPIIIQITTCTHYLLTRSLWGQST